MAKKNNTNNTNTLPEQEFNFIVSDVRIPRMVPLQTLADESGISYKALSVSYTHLTLPTIRLV